MKKTAFLFIKLAVTVGVLVWLIAKVEPRMVQLIPRATLAMAAVKAPWSAYSD
jgi:hypothetical protein